MQSLTFSNQTFYNGWDFKWSFLVDIVRFYIYDKFRRAGSNFFRLLIFMFWFILSSNNLNLVKFYALDKTQICRKFFCWKTGTWGTNQQLYRFPKCSNSLSFSEKQSNAFKYQSNVYFQYLRWAEPILSIFLFQSFDFFGVEGICFAIWSPNSSFLATLDIRSIHLRS